MTLKPLRGSKVINVLNKGKSSSTFKFNQEGGLTSSNLTKTNAPFFRKVNRLQLAS